MPQTKLLGTKRKEDTGAEGYYPKPHISKKKGIKKERRRDQGAGGGSWGKRRNKISSKEREGE